MGGERSDSKNYSRRAFLHLGGVATLGGIGGAWIHRSSSFSARFLRDRFDEVGEKIAPAAHQPIWKSWQPDRISVAWLGHSTVLINFFGATILTDPVMGRRLGATLGALTVGPKRFVASPLKISQLPPLDLVLLSHAHFDHMDMATLSRLHPGALITAKATSDLLEGVTRAPVRELGWGERHCLKPGGENLEVEAFEVRHWGARWRSDRYRGYNGYIISKGGKKIIFGGDTAMTPLFRQLRGKGPYELACMPIGAYEPRPRSHCTPEEALEMANDAGAQYIVPIHHKTFNLGKEPLEEPISRLRQALSREPSRLAVSEIGETFIVPA